MNLKPYSIFMLLCICIFGYTASAQPSFDKNAFYTSIQSKDLNNINAQLKIVGASSIPEKDAYTGALLMRKAGLVKGPSNKLSVFKSGHTKLEDAIKKNNSNAEFRFLRLIIQENAPGILGYKSDMQQDGDYIKKSYKDLPQSVQQAISNYSKQSKILKPADFNS
jgi:hypothetical protein